MNGTRQNFPFLGFGVGLRPVHYPHILEEWPVLDWFEVISENYLIPGGRPLAILDRIRERYPIVMHGVSLSIGSADPLDWNYLRQLKALERRVQPQWVSDHLCWSSTGRHSLHDLLPVPHTEEAARHVVTRVRQVQDFLERPILLENVSSYLEFTTSMMPEWEFLTRIAEDADCAILLDVNNIYVSSVNHDFDPLQYLQAIPVDRVGQFHLAGHSDQGTHLLDTHDHTVCDAVWTLYEHAIARFGPVSTLIEWDDHIPPFEQLLSEVTTARARYDHFIAHTGADARIAANAHHRA